MTFIATIINRSNIPFLISDVLISSKIKTANFQSPTNHFPINKFLPQNLSYNPRSFCQKAYIISDRLCVILAGNLVDMKNFLEDLYTNFNHYPLTKANLFKFLDSNSNEYNVSDLAYGIIFMDHLEKDKLECTFIHLPKLMYNIKDAEKHFGWNYTNSHFLGNICAFGSGRYNFFDIVNERSNYTSWLTEGSVDQGIQILASFAAKVFAMEKATLQTLMNGWGGGLELIYYNIADQCFNKIDNIAYILFEGEFDNFGDVDLPKPRLILHYKYYQDLLYITAFSVIKHDILIMDNYLEIFSRFDEYKVNLFIVPTILKNDSIIPENHNYSFATSLIAIGYDIRNTRTGRQFYPSAFIYNKEISVSAGQNGQLKICLRKEITDEFRRQANQVYENF